MLITFGHMCCRTDDPRPTARKVAIAYPSVPTNSDGTIELFQPFAAAIPAAVVGPAKHQHDDGYTSAFKSCQNMTSKTQSAPGTHCNASGHARMQDHYWHDVYMTPPSILL